MRSRRNRPESAATEAVMKGIERVDGDSVWATEEKRKVRSAG